MRLTDFLTVELDADSTLSQQAHDSGTNASDRVSRRGDRRPIQQPWDGSRSDCSGGEGVSDLARACDVGLSGTS